MSKVSTEGINSGAFSLSGEISKVKSSISEIKSQVESIEALATELQSYNGKLVAGSHQEETKYTTVNCRPQYAYTTHSWSTWKISGTEGVTSGKGQVLNELDEIESALGDLSSEVKNLEGSAEAIDSYINSIQADLGENIDPSKLSLAFTESMAGLSLLSHLAYTKEDAAAGNFIGKDKILTDYWTDKALQFEKQDNGTYAIYQKDANGNKNLMGYTTTLAAASYMKRLDREVNGEKLVATKAIEEEVETSTTGKWNPGILFGRKEIHSKDCKLYDFDKNFFPSARNYIDKNHETMMIVQKPNGSEGYTDEYGNPGFRTTYEPRLFKVGNGVIKEYAILNPEDIRGIYYDEDLDVYLEGRNDDIKNEWGLIKEGDVSLTYNDSKPLHSYNSVNEVLDNWFTYTY